MTLNKQFFVTLPSLINYLSFVVLSQVTTWSTLHPCRLLENPGLATHWLTSWPSAPSSVGKGSATAGPMWEGWWRSWRENGTCCVLLMWCTITLVSVSVCLCVCVVCFLQDSVGYEICGISLNFELVFHTRTFREYDGKIFKDRRISQMLKA